MARLSVSNLFLAIAVFAAVSGLGGVAKSTSDVAWICAVYFFVLLCVLFRRPARTTAVSLK